MVLTLEHAAELLQVRPGTVRRLARAGKLPATKIGRCWRFDHVQLSEWIQARALENVRPCQFESAKALHIGKSGFSSLDARLEALLAHRSWRSRAARRGASSPLLAANKTRRETLHMGRRDTALQGRRLSKALLGAHRARTGTADALALSSPLAEITRDNILKIREIRRRQVSAATVNRELAVLRFVLNRCVTDWAMLDAAPKVSLFQLERQEPRWATREQVHSLLELLPPHLRDMAILACATGLRRSNITGLEWNRVDSQRATAFVPASQAKGKRAIVVPLNADALTVIERWRGRHARYVFVFRKRRHRASSTRAWRTACKAVGLKGSDSTICDIPGLVGKCRRKRLCLICKSWAAGLRSQWFSVTRIFLRHT